MNNIIQDCITKRKIAELFLKYPAREFTVNELSKLSKISYATTWRFVQKLDMAGLILTKTVGHSLVCRLNESSPFLKEIKKIIEIEFSPHRLAVNDFVNRVKRLSGVKRIVLFGSVARRREKLISDIDIAVIINKKDKNLENVVTSVTDEILKKSRMKIIPLVMTDKEAGKDKQFTEELKKGEVLYERLKRG